MQHRTTDTREIRVFLSSTFRDMQYERDYLIKNIFPQIRHACRERLVEFTEVDLRWGVTQEEAEQGKVVRICLEEIDRCRPYFLSFMGERYGWSPSDGDLHNKQELIQQFPVVEDSIRAGKSVTEMEVLHGVLNNPYMAGHAFFYLRAPALSETLSQQTSDPAEYFETDDNNRNKLAELKARIRQSGFPVRENYPSIESLGEQIKVDLLAVLDERYPADQTPNPLQAERNVHEAYAENRCQAYIPNPADISALDECLRPRIPDAPSIPLIIGGESGLGKSALFAYWVNHVEASKPEQFIIQHYAGVSGDATPTAVLRRIMLEIRERTQEQDEVPIKPDDIVQDFPWWLAKVRSNDPLLIVLDAINQFEWDNLGWLPDYIPPNVTLVVSCLPGVAFDRLAQRGWQAHIVQPMDEQRREQLIDTYLANYRKALSTSQRQTLAHASQCANPLFLLTVLEELRVFGSFEQLDARMQTCLAATNPAELFGIVLTRMEADYGKQTVQHVMSAIWAARKGLSETELMGITGQTRLDISTFLLALDYHLARKSGLLNFFHDYLRQAVKARYLPRGEDIKEQHRKLAEWFDRQELDARKAEELPWQWQQARENKKLKECIAEIPMFNVFCSSDSRVELLGYWKYLGRSNEAGKQYVKSFMQWEKSARPTGISAVSNNLGLFLAQQLHDLASAEWLLERAVSISENQSDIDDLVTSLYLGNLALVKNERNKHSLAVELLHRSISLREENLGKNHPDTAKAIRALARSYRQLGDYRQALELHKRALDIFQGCEIENEISTCLQDLGVLLLDMKEYESAEQQFQQSIAIDDKYNLLNPITLFNMADLKMLMHDYEAAVVYLRRVLPYFEKVHASQHPRVRVTMRMLAESLLHIQNYSAAEELFRKTLSIRENESKPDFEKVADNISSLASAVEAQGRFSEAIKLFHRELEIRESHLGSKHHSTALACAKLASVLHDSGQEELAVPLYRRALDICDEVLPNNHPDIATILNNFARLLVIQGEMVSAEPLYRRALEIFEDVYGKNSANTRTVRENLSEVTEAIGKSESNRSTTKGETTMSMRITETIVNWLEEQEWEERPDVDEEKQTSSTGFTHSVNDDFSVNCYLDAVEKTGFIKLFMYFTDSKIPESKINEVIKFSNLVNVGIPIGHLAVIPDDRLLRYYAGIDVEEASLEPRHISNMLGAGLRTMGYRLPQFMAICFGGKTAEEAMEIEPE